LFSLKEITRHVRRKCIAGELQKSWGIHLQAVDRYDYRVRLLRAPYPNPVRANRHSQKEP
jgi:hypothetical protein